MRSVLLAAAGLTLAGLASGATLPAGFSETTLASGLSSPTAMAFAPDGRLFVCQQGGQLRVVKDGHHEALDDLLDMGSSPAPGGPAS